MQERIASIIEEYDAQGDHRTGTEADARGAEWLAARIENLGVKSELDTFAFKRIQINTAGFRVGTLTIEGVPLFDCGLTGGEVEGSIGALGSDADIGVAMSLPITSNQADLVRRQSAAAELEEARRTSRHKAIVLVTDESMPTEGVAAINAPHFLKPYGPPVLQIPNRHWREICALMEGKARATVIVACDYVDASTSNVQASVAGSDPSLAPLLVMTPRSAWWSCASERGGGIAAFLEIMRAVRELNAPRTVIFTANTGHELGHIGLDRFLGANPGLLTQAQTWMHLGANFAARLDGGIRLQYSNEDLRSLVLSHCGRQQVAPLSEAPYGARPAGEARNIFDGGGNYVSIVGRNGLFHHPMDRFPDAVDVPLTTRWVAVLVGVATDLAARST